jgi:DNA-binding transcriptional ArsR family regulator
VGTDLLTSIRAEIDSRLSELRPMLEEYQELLSVIDALTPDSGTASAPTPHGAAATAAPVPAARGAAATARTAPMTAARGAAATARTAPMTRFSAKALSAKKSAARTAFTKEPSAKAPRRATARTRARRPAISATGRAILAALEHGSHTVAELVVVSALPAPDIRRDLRPLLKLEAIVKTERDGKIAYALPASGT